MENKIQNIKNIVDFSSEAALVTIDKYEFRIHESQNEVTKEWLENDIETATGVEPALIKTKIEMTAVDDKVCSSRTMYVAYKRCQIDNRIRLLQ
jgi:hypothetical protein